MSRNYEVKAYVVVPVKNNVVWRTDFLKALENEGFDLLDEGGYKRDDYYISWFKGEICLGNGETEDEWRKKVCKEFWTVLGEYAEVEINILCLDDIPYDAFKSDQDVYQQIMGEEKK